MESLRMCIVCKEMFNKKDLNRIVKDKEGNIFLDVTGKKNGRGAYICNHQECIDKLKKNKMLNKTFKTAISDEIYNKIEEEILERK